LYKKREEDFNLRGVNFRELERILLLQVIDHNWKNHLYELDHLRKGVVLRAYGQKDPLIEYQKESYALFERMLDRIRDQMIEYLFKIQLPPTLKMNSVQNKKENENKNFASKSVSNFSSSNKKDKEISFKKVGRNDPCPCGSGKKYKKCCGKNVNV
ncbi:MAG: SEC-C metal-binding domain-containing protein, partial [Elusimicrobiales bacterium]|nr:SEC-C metal-binding domain-containing protein [Elusimicrobiales bacterium]